MPSQPRTFTLPTRSSSSSSPPSPSPSPSPASSSSSSSSSSSLSTERERPAHQSNTASTTAFGRRRLPAHPFRAHSRGEGTEKGDGGDAQEDFPVNKRPRAGAARATSASFSPLQPVRVFVEDARSAFQLTVMAEAADKAVSRGGGRPAPAPAPLPAPLPAPATTTGDAAAVVCASPSCAASGSTSCGGDEVVPAPGSTQKKHAHDGGGGGGSGRTLSAAIDQNAPPPADGTAAAAAVAEEEAAVEQKLLREQQPALPRLLAQPLEVSRLTLVNPEFKYAETEHDTFQRNGYCVFPSFLTPEGLAYLQSRADLVWHNKGKYTQEAWLMNLHQVLPREDNWMWRLATHPTVLSIIEKHLGPDFVFNSGQLLIKPPVTEKSAVAGGGKMPFHQDGQILRTFWIALDDVDEHNGSLIVKPGWHTKGPMMMRHLTKSALAKTVQGRPQYEPGQDVSKANAVAGQVTHTEIAFDQYCKGGRAEFYKDLVTYRFKAGGMAMHHPSLPHASMHNTTRDRWRRIIILRYLPAAFPKPHGRCHQHWRTGELFEKHSYLVRGRDVGAQDFAREPVHMAPPGQQQPPPQQRQRPGPAEVATDAVGSVPTAAPNTAEE